MGEQHMGTPTALLRQEHELILQVADALGRMIDGNTLDVEWAERCVTFIRLFADMCHHGKEEDLLFPCLESHGMPRDAGPIAVMLYDHDEGRGFVNDMAGAVELSRSGEAGATESLNAAARGFISLITDHIAKENGILFEMADQMIQGDALTNLCAAYDELAEERFEGYSKSDLQDLADQIIAHSSGG